MGRRGPAPTPTKLRVLRGTIRDPGDEPVPMLVTTFDAPDDLADEVAVEVWRDVVRALGHTGVITAADLDALRAYSEAVSRYRQASRLLARSGPVIKGRGGELVKNPLNQIVRDNADLMRQYARELGLTPAARVGMRGKGDATKDEGKAKLDALLARKHA